MFPTNNNIYIPSDPFRDIRPLTIEEVREHGKIVSLSEDETKATVQVTIGQVVCYCGVILKDGKIESFIERPVNKYITVKEVPTSELGAYNPPK